MQSIQKSAGLTILRDGFDNLVGGMDSSRYPDLIGQNHSSLAVNISFRGGKPKTRPGFRQVAIGDTESSAVKLVRNGVFQGGTAYYSTTLGRSILVGVYSGWVLAIDVVGGTTTLLNPSDRNDATRKHYLLQAENYLIIQNGVNIPLIWDGAAATTRRSHTGSNNPVVGTSNSSIVNTAGTAKVTTTTAHYLSNGDYVQVDGVNVAGYVGQFYIFNVTPTTFDFTVSSSLSNPTIFGTTRLCPEIPIGLMMAYGQGRIFLASPNRVELTAGDIIYGDLNGQVGNILNWTENQYLAEGLSFRLTSSQGRIKALAFPSFQDTGTGQGELFAFGEYGVSSFAVSNPRAAITNALTGAVITPGWRDTQIQKIVLSDSGCASQASIINFTNGDLFYRDLVGIRSYRSARGDMQSYGQTPISAEVDRILKNDVKTRLDLISGCHFDNRMLMTCSPRYDVRKVRIVSISEDGLVTTADDHGIEEGTVIEVGGTTALDGEYTAGAVTPTTVAISIPAEADTSLTYGAYVAGDGTGVEIFHKGLLALDFTSTSTVGAKSYAAWEGVWCGIDFQHIVSGFFDGRARCFSFVYGGVGDNSVWEITTDQPDDTPLDGDPVRVSAVLETREFEFESPFNKKKLRRLDIWLTDISGRVDMVARYATDGRPCWTYWPPQWSRCATVSDLVLPETNPNSEGLLQNRPQIRNQITQPMPPNTCDEVQGGILNIGYGVRIRLEWTGNTTIEKLVVTADDVVEDPKATCPAGATQ